MTLMNILLDAMQNVDMTMYLAKFGADWAQVLA